MKVILREDVEKLGQAGELVDVKDGYGRNYLIPQAKAILATKSTIAEMELRMRQAAARAELTVQEAKDLAKLLEATSVTISVTTGEDDKIHGTVTNVQIADALAEREILVDRRNISIDEDVKTLGEYTATVSLVGDLNPQIKFWVVKAD
ncbi:MAG: 50S ribosomal protein L9 [Balneola sp.]|jgi:large subunit ribosomal protein L9|uniref:50S ribosomal protein L9 n=1 Tax=Balneola sp. EhC07 TaxID=1849360 RepID=UPI0007F491D3|nr:50S ribosomal protein L9 [Balneola sp. EhC07]MBO6572242.1 50S ribosomal protein L9 [Balneola sp.]MBR9918494.1 50S ribosomal protein L9 [bacterium]MBO6623014.1 50S ribosomal protein L9 [Balneola sp.]MBO6651662.1 50S ribosomal protein L9 [Balneola sp.]MBO6711932.1 50S ribosomal protein L9 [Balneola sp.]|tara:strand:+ start:82372 stop:82818 length:447 start_codon:yes stop_codon:yes gene_type:complete